ncbi:hypothetical protein [Brevibacterium zhoupengii]|uniref:hypothetical protein n=1 Tax=Brevibacterium zhoupengii TaxID=2898795 RepID=UPI001E2C3745|nr:hypothetical protein [Brevibacterium zhoupengii]
MKQDLLRFGLTDDDVRRAQQCCLQKIRRGHYAVIRPCSSPQHAVLHSPGAAEPISYPQTFGDIRDRSEALKPLIRSRLHELRSDDVYSHISAALIHGIRPPFPATDQAEIIRTGYHENFPTLRIYDRIVPPADRTTVGDFAVTDLSRTLSDIAHDYPSEISVPMISEALRVGNTSKPDLLEQMKIRRRGCRVAKQGIELSDPLHESQGETLCAVKFHRYSIGEMVPQVKVHDRTGKFLGRCDFKHARLPLIVEFHGLGKYYLNESGPDRASRDNHARHMRLTNAGFTVFNLVWADLFRSEMFTAIKKHIAESRAHQSMPTP